MLQTNTGSWTVFYVFFMPTRVMEIFCGQLQEFGLKDLAKLTIISCAHSDLKSALFILV